MLAKATSVINPIVYYFMIERFRNEVKTVISNACSSRKNKSKEGSRNQIITSSLRSYKTNTVNASSAKKTSDVTVNVIDVGLVNADVVVEAGNVA